MTAPQGWVHGCPGHAGEPVWLLSTSPGEWVAECGFPGCGWSVSDLVPEFVDDLAAGHATTHHAAGSSSGGAA
jgi:hypothetical protein